MKKKLLDQYKSKTYSGPLNGTIVIGFCYYVAGPIALQSLVRQGALVIKIEAKPIGDPSRHVFSPAIFNSLAQGQLSVAFDLQQPEDRRLLQTLLDIADVIVDNRSVEAQERDELLQSYLKKPDKSAVKIYCTIDGFPNSKVYRMPGLDASIQAITGFAYSNCNSPSQPLKVGVPVLDIVTGVLAAHHIVANLFFLSKNELPPAMKNVIRIAVSLAGTSLWLQSHQVINALEGKEYFRTGNQDKFAAPFSYYKTGNGLISIATVNETQFKNFCINVLKNKAFHEKYATVQKRIECQDDFERELNTLLKIRDKEHWLAECEIHRVPAAPVLTVSDAVQQSFVKELISYSVDQKPVITSGAFSSLFSLPKSNLAPAPALDQDRQPLTHVLKEECIRARL